MADCRRRIKVRTAPLGKSIAEIGWDAAAPVPWPANLAFRNREQPSFGKVSARHSSWGGLEAWAWCVRLSIQPQMEGYSNPIRASHHRLTSRTRKFRCTSSPRARGVCRLCSTRDQENAGKTAKGKPADPFLVSAPINAVL
jgi:hypothetical protein